MESFIKDLNSPLFNGISREDIPVMLNCIGYYVASYKKGEIISSEGEYIRNIGIILSGRVDIVKEDLWGNRTVLVHIEREGLFGETFVCGKDSMSVVNYEVTQDATILFVNFDRAMHSCASNACSFHHRLIENMVGVIADKNRALIQKLEVLSKRSLKEKILAYLSIQAQQNKSGYFEIPLGRVELAEYLCVDRSALTRELNKMKAEGSIDFDKNCFRLL